MTNVFVWGVLVGYLMSVVQTTIRDIWKAKREAKKRVEAANLRAKRMG